MALSSCPLYTKNLGDSLKLKTTKRRKKTPSVIAPSVNIKYRHPILLALVQHATPDATLLHDGRGSASLKLGEQENVGI